MALSLSDLGLEDKQNVPNVFPYGEPSPRIALVGDMPYDNVAKQPLSASHYGFLCQLLNPVDFEVKDCFIGNVLGYHPPSTFKKLGWDDDGVKRSVRKLYDDLIQFKPDVVIPLGQTALEAFKKYSPIDDYRGAPFVADVKADAINSEQMLVLPTYHPSDLFKRYQLCPIVTHDLEKAHRLATQGWTYPQQNIIFQPTFDQACRYLRKFLSEKALLSTDIETKYKYPLYTTCVGMAWSPTDAIVIPFVTPKGRYWSEEEEWQIWKLVAEVCEYCPHIGQNIVRFDHKFMAKFHKIMLNATEDSMLMHWEVYCEMKKSLGFQSSLYTDNPYHKNMLKDARSGKIPYTEEYRYCGIDCCVTWQCWEGAKRDLAELPPKVTEHYKFNVRVSRAFQYMAIKGCRLDTIKLANRLSSLRDKQNDLQKIIDKEHGAGLNVRSYKQMRELLYKTMGLREIKKPVKDKETGERRSATSTDYLSILQLAHEYPNKPTLMVMGKLRKLMKRITDLNGLQVCPQTGRLHYEFGIVGTDTGRVAGYKPMDGFGFQPHSYNRLDRDLLLPDEGHHWLKFDLEGADSVTYAAQLAALGSDTMLLDLKAGLKPAMVLCIATLRKDDSLMTAPRDVLLGFVPEVKAYCEAQKKSGKENSLYDIMKVVTHGSAYMLGAKGMHLDMLKKSEGEVYMPIPQCEAFQELLKKRYPLQKLYDQVRSVIATHGFMDCASGTRRTFYGRKDDNTLRAALAYPPQNHTTYVINVILDRLYHHPSNRVSSKSDDVRLFISLLNQVHDEGDGQFPIGEEERAKSIFYSFTDVPLSYWGIDFKIDVEAQYGPNWAMKPEEIKDL